MSPEENGHLNDYVAQEHGMKIIDRCAETKDASLSLSSKRLSEVPGSLLKLDHLQYLYLDGNQLRALPGNFFDCLRELSWLDLRNNELVSLPTAYVGRHKALRHLLLEGNRLETLPLELGLVSTLQGLNIANNPLKFPPADVIQKGVKEVLRFFRSILHVKSTAHSEKSLNGSEKGAAGAGNAVECSLEDEASAAALASQDGLARQRPSTAGSAKSEVTGQAAALHAVDSRGDLKLTKAARLRRSEASADRRLSRKKETNPLGLPSDELIDEKLTELGKKTRERARNESVDKLLQKQRNAEILSEFRDKAKNLQRKKEVEKRIKGKLDYVEAVDSAPFDIDPEHMQMISNEDRIKDGVRQTHERVRRVLSPTVIRKLEAARIEKERELHEKLKQHTQAMKERRQKPKGTPLDEMDAAVRELEIAKRLQHELDRRRKDLEYRFKAFGPADTSASLATTGKRSK